MRPGSPLALALAAVLVSACGGSQEKPDNTAWETREGMRGLGVDAADEIEPVGSRIATQQVGYTWTGVRHDLALNPAKKLTATCSCLSVGVGSPSDSTFLWRGVRPELSSDKVAIAIGSTGIDCPGGPAEADRRPSISAVDRVGNDVVIEVEEVPTDRPIASGAVVSAIEPGGHVYVRQRNKKLPYAKPTGKDLCRVK